MSRRQPAVAAEAASRMRPWLIHGVTYAGIAIAALAGITATAIATAVAWHLIGWAWSAPTQPLILAGIAAAGWGLYRWDAAASAAQDDEEDAT